MALKAVAFFKASFSSVAFCRIAPANGCSEPCSKEAATFKISNFEFRISVAVKISVIFGLPTVSVPVLSKTMLLTLCKVSKLPASLIKTPSVAARPTPTIMAVGVANPKAHGQATTKTAIPVLIPKPKFPDTTQKIKVPTANNKITGTK